MCGGTVLCDSARAIGALEAQTMSVERLTLAIQRIADGIYGRCRSAMCRSRPRAAIGL